MEFVQLQLIYLNRENAGIQSKKCYETVTKHGFPIFVMEPSNEEAQEIIRQSVRMINGSVKIPCTGLWKSKRLSGMRPV